MKAIVQSEYGSAEVLHLQEVDRPPVSASSVLVRVRAASVHAGDWHLMRGDPFLLRFIYGGIRRPKITILGSDVAGEVEAVGQAVSQFKPGDPVFGDLTECGFGAFAEYVSVPESALVLKPENLTFEEAATVPVSGLSALQGLRDVGQLRAGERVLVRGAAGGVGSFAVQIAKALGAEVTGVCSPHKKEGVRKLGADEVMDYDQAVRKDPCFDLILDTAAYRSVFASLAALKPGGRYVMVGGSMPYFFQVLLLGSLMSTLSGRRVKNLVCQPNSKDLTILKDWIERGTIYPYVDRTYPLEQVPDAICALEQRQVCGKVAISIGSVGQR
ncbi:NAD(P)-dependent alcohol dehydrogenase [Synechococcus sp. Nb3U1]|uniref:NAD(P)-dependent alcohol dehydrogenase n=1 Tax=Synechococcus sp. Nb3U1 TaxID=1914529 RepID=UPI001F300D74|nr:NAD(P)-dependent alcohol dehydrogenase [Synechococcus sp. Nb3U1]MCF2971091.1 NAD(P)-dependent alcohol dehydrogenase [Synechococcus sp. Nb3U1]